MFFCVMKNIKRTDLINQPIEAYLDKLAKRIKSLRVAKGYSSYEAFAYDHNLSRALYGRYEKGKDLRFSSLVKVVKAFGLTLEEFFSEGFD